MSYDERSYAAGKQSGEASANARLAAAILDADNWEAAAKAAAQELNQIRSEAANWGEEIARLRADMDQRMIAYIAIQEQDEEEIKRLRNLLHSIANHPEIPRLISGIIHNELERSKKPDAQ